MDRICPQCQRRTDRATCSHDGFATVLADQLDPLLGSVFEGRYRVEKLLGRGGMGAVYRAVQVVVNRPVALKVLHAALLDNLKEVARFQQEARAIASLNHPNTIKLIDFGTTDEGGSFYLVMEYLEGEDLAALMRREAPLDASRAVALVTQALLSLAEAHSRGIVHRDLKPQNLFVTQVYGQKEFIKVLDFGIAKVVGEGAADTQLTGTGIAIGSPRYMSPEQARAKPVSPQTDLYAIGCILYEMLTGKPVFSAGSASEVILAHLKDPPPPPVLHGRRLQGPLVDLVVQCLAKDPADRPASAEEILGRLAKLPPSPVTFETELGKTQPVKPLEATNPVKRRRTVPLVPAAPEPTGWEAAGETAAVPSDGDRPASDADTPGGQRKPAPTVELSESVQREMAQQKPVWADAVGVSSDNEAVSTGHATAERQSSRNNYNSKGGAGARPWIIAGAAAIVIAGAVAAVLAASGSDSAPPPPDAPVVAEAQPAPSVALGKAGDRDLADASLAAPDGEPDAEPAKNPVAVPSPQPDTDPASDDEEPPLAAGAVGPDAGAAEVVEALLTDASPERVQVVVTSVPSEATIVEGGEALGKTPLQVQVDVGASERQLVLRRRGYEDAEVALTAEKPIVEVKLERKKRARKGPSKSTKKPKKKEEGGFGGAW